MPALAGDTFDMPLAKRQKKTSEGKVHAQGNPHGGAKIFAPFRVCQIDFSPLLCYSPIRQDTRACVANAGSLHQCAPGKINLSDHHFGGPFVADL